jgi:hypothetical protein
VGSVLPGGGAAGGGALVRGQVVPGGAAESDFELALRLQVHPRRPSKQQHAPAVPIKHGRD